MLLSPRNKEYDMLNKFSLMAAATVLLLGAGPLSGGMATAFATSPPSPAATAQGQAANDGMIELAQSVTAPDRRVRGTGDRRMRTSWDRNRDGRRCSRRYGNCNNYYRGSYYETPWWTLPLIVGGGIIAQDRYRGGYGSRHVQWCSDRYRSYNARTNTWVAYGGAVRQCVSPYR
jgi:BA14K-like protein